jgi:hypothetical protein
VLKTSTPKAICNLREMGYYLNMFIGSYKGGRNEAFKYGIDKNKT